MGVGNLCHAFLVTLLLEVAIVGFSFLLQGKNFQRHYNTFLDYFLHLNIDLVEFIAIFGHVDQDLGGGELGADLVGEMVQAVDNVLGADGVHVHEGAALAWGIASAENGGDVTLLK